MYKNQGKKTLWVYTIILFTCAAIVLIWTGYSQIRISNNLEEYQNRLSDKENENNLFQHNLSSALAQNNKLNEELSDVKNKLTEALTEKESLRKKITDLEKRQSNTLDLYEQVLKADIEYTEGNTKKCAIMILDIDKDGITENNLLIKYNDLVNKTYKTASELFYSEGYNNYNNKEYDKAIENLELALKLYDKDYYADDCYYFIAYSEYNTENFDKAKDALNTIINNYPNSSYYKDAKDLLNIIENK